MNLMTNKQAIYSVVLGKCSMAIKFKIKEEKDYKDKSIQHDALCLLKTLKFLVVGIDENMNPIYTLCKSLSSLLRMKQGQNESLDTW